MKRLPTVLAALSCIALGACSGGDAESGATGGPAAAGRDAVDSSAHGLAAYVGKYPFDAVNGVTWEKNAQVIAGVRAAVVNPALVRKVLDYNGPAAPIAMVDGKVVAGLCEAHNCGDRNWEIFVDPADGATQVCYHDEAETPGRSVWYFAGGKRELRKGACAIE